MSGTRRVRSFLRPGTRLGGRYVVDRLVGSGGASMVYGGRDEETGRPVAVKVLDPAPEHREAERRRMFREARLTSALRHPHVVEIYGSGTVDHEPPGRRRAFLVMELLAGLTVAQRLDDVFWMPLEAVQPIAAQLLDALGAIHRVGVVHRDVTPSNVFVTGETGREHIKLIDFGIGRDLGDPSSRVTAPDVVVGTLGYMAPEQLFGEPPCPLTDVYGAGATIYRMLTGRPPAHFRASRRPRRPRRALAPTRSPSARCAPPPPRRSPTR